MHPYFIFQLSADWTISIPAYSFFACIGLFFMMLLLYFRTQAAGIPYLRYLLLIGYMVAGVGIGSKALFVVTQIPKWLENPTLQNLAHIIWTSGFVFYGGLLGAIAGSAIFARQFQIPFQTLSNLAAPGFPLFHFWGRIGCFFAGCCYGKPAVWGIAMAEDLSTPRIPVQLIGAVCIAAIFVILLFAERKHPAVSLLNLYLGLYAVCRFLLEFYRGDTLRGFLLGLSTSQWVSLVILGYLIISALHKKEKPTAKPQPE